MNTKIMMKPFKIESIRELTGKTVDSFPISSFKMVPKDGKKFDFKPGMFSSIYVHQDDKLFRSYSIASSPNEDYIEFMIEMINGKFTSILSKLYEGDEVFLTEPKGTFIFDADEERDITFIAAGVGIAPFFSMLRYLRYLNKKKNLTLFYSVKHKVDIVNLQELKSYEDLGLKMHITLTRDPPDASWNGEFGRINIEMLNRYLKNLNNNVFYICGGIKFVKDLVDILIKSGVKDDDIKRDIWGE